MKRRLTVRRPRVARFRERERLQQRDDLGKVSIGHRARQRRHGGVGVGVGVRAMRFFILLDTARARNARRDVDEETHRESQKQTRRRASTARSTRGRGADDHGESASVND